MYQLKTLYLGIRGIIYAVINIFLRRAIMDLKKKIDEIVKKIKADDGFAKKFKNDPVKAVESVLGVDLPDDQVNKLIDGVKAKLNLDKADGLFGKIKKLF